MNKNLKIIPLGGVDDIGSINCTLIEYNDRIIIMDMGFGFPSNDLYGVDYLIPNTEYLIRNKHKIEGIIITHAHMDHIGGLAYVIKDLDYPEIFASKFAIEFITHRLKEKGVYDQAKIVEITKDSHLVSGEFELNFFGVNHSIPEAMGVIVKTPAGIIVNSGDFKFDNQPVNEPVADYNRIAAVGNEGVLALLSDSTNSFRKGLSPSESIVADSLESIIKDAKHRVIVATFSSLFTRIYQLIKIAERYDRKVLVIGRSMELSLKIARKLGYIKAKNSLFIEQKELSKYKDRDVLVLATGSQGENMAALSRMSRGEHRTVKIKKSDTIILSASIIPGNNIVVQELIDELSKKEPTVFYAADEMNLHSSGHGYQEDQKIMINLVKPKYFIPVHGSPAFLHKHSKTAQSIGIKEENIIVPTQGQAMEYDGKTFKKTFKIPSNAVMVTGDAVGKVATTLLHDRQQLSNFGMLNILISINLQSKKMLTKPTITTRGFLDEKSLHAFEPKLQKYIEDLVLSNTNLFHKNTEKLEEIINKNIRKFVYHKTQKEPLLVITIVG